MKKLIIIFFTIIIILIPNSVYAEEVQLVKCVDGDTAKFKLEDNKEYTVRFLAIDTPETVHPTIKDEAYGKEASTFTCNKLTNAKSIVLEYDNNSDKFDKYGRLLSWIFVDNKLLQLELIENGLGEVAYLYGDYKYTSLLQDAEEVAKVNKIGMFSETKILKPEIEKTFFDKVIDFFKELIVETINNLLNSIVKGIENMI